MALWGKKCCASLVLSELDKVEQVVTIDLEISGKNFVLEKPRNHVVNFVHQKLGSHGDIYIYLSIKLPKK